MVSDALVPRIPYKRQSIEPKRLMLAQISVCNGCCCGVTAKGHPEVPVEWLKREWKIRGLLKRMHLSIAGCLGPCDVPNVVSITSSQGTQWLAHLSSQRHYQMLADWAEQCKDQDRLLPLPEEMALHSMQPYQDESSLCFVERS